MHEKHHRQAENQQGQVTVVDLLMVMGGVVPVAVVGAAVRASGGGLLQYLIGLPLALVLGALVVVLEWHSRTFLWQRSQGYRGTTQNVVAIGLLALQLMWIVLAGTFGHVLAHLVIKFSM